MSDMKSNIRAMERVLVSQGMTRSTARERIKRLQSNSMVARHSPEVTDEYGHDGGLMKAIQSLSASIASAAS
ncbi:hypothetical protein [Rhizobium rhizogenes]|uniref:Uncharacterized protein n=1 Tax=Rhizobium rhizogenes NBRC 13257 TaxID=1220581 RepID=A0AA87QC09_RHIRH|nr:hypothetical protein [Rhizobium rhizogenes]KEA04830.1 hypothetical protein CN09_13335 [Rhizobium rhizogenes]NTG65389.1 hypothetical protein [Rhizobium rhizogenes]NTI66253.1 hypothetical protein [Rhizobium rhizogenes]NTI79161.1 hypothetical protein [Rhizobium rhizogenes]NTJ21262.1 hypothetical protein [Rhizobium rhizogenes]